MQNVRTGLFLFFISLTLLISNNINADEKSQQIESILSKLSLEEKAGQLSLIDIEGEPTAEHLKMIKEGKVGSVIKSRGVENNLKLQKIAIEDSKSGIPILFQEDVIHGYRTIAPIPLGESASWDLEAIRASAAVAAREAKASGIQLTYAPMVDIARDPRWGRILEGAGEDPYLGSLIAAARVKGFQESGDKYQNVLATVKHFIGYGASMAGRDYNILEFSEREMREVHLQPFQAAVDAGVSSLMVAFNAYNGVSITANRFLLQDVLKKELGFEGLIMTDWNTITGMVESGLAADKKKATEMAVHAGIHMDMVSENYADLIPQLVRDGRISEAQVDDAVRQVLRLKQIAGLLDDPYSLFDIEREKSEILSERNIRETLDITLKSMVLLKNENKTLPLKKSIKKIAVIGPLAKSQMDLLGWWHMMGDKNEVVSVYQGIEEELSDRFDISYAKGCDIDKFKPAGRPLIKKAVKAAKKADAVIMVLGEEYWMSGEGGGLASLHLPGLQEELLEKVAATGKPVISVIISGRPNVLTNIAAHSDAVLQAWMPGTTGGTAVAKILSGEFNPSGRLPVSFPVHQGQIPIFHSYKSTSHTFIEDEVVGRYSTTHRDIQERPLYPFGYGLSYTEFEYSDIKLDSSEMSMDGKITATIDVKNVGERAGREVVQLYLRDKVASVLRPMKELKDFALLDLKPGETQTASFEITRDKLEYIGADLKKTVDPGDFILFIGPNSEKLKNTEFSVKN